MSEQADGPIDLRGMKGRGIASPPKAGPADPKQKPKPKQGAEPDRPASAEQG